MGLTFYLVRLKSEGGKRVAQMCLRFKATPDATEDFTGNEPVLCSFAVPLGPESVAPKEFMASEEYTFTLTYGDGRRFQGFCRKFLPPPPRVGSKLRFPQILCLISEHPWCNFYFKVLQVLEQLIKSGDSLLDSDLKELPANSYAGQFLKELGAQLSSNPGMGQVLRVPFPKTVNMLGISPPRLMGASTSGDPLVWSEEQLELQVPPDCGNGRWNCGISLARLLWNVPASSLVTLISSMLLERRIILVGQSRDTVTAAVQAASALLYPFKWHHIYLPLLPKTFKDYLTAPMPFMVGLPAQLLPVLKGIPMNEVTLIDLDLGQCDPAPGSERDDAVHLPYRERLEAALQAAFTNLKSPTEYESSPLIAGIMQEYFLKLIGSYRRFLHEEGVPFENTAVNYNGGSASAAPSPRCGPGEDRSVHRRNNSAGEDVLKGSGYTFEHGAFVASHRHSEKARKFLSMFRHSQMYEVFMQERLKMASQGSFSGEGGEPEPFEQRLERYEERKKVRMEQRARARSAMGQQSRWSSASKQQHRRTDSEEGLVKGSSSSSSMRRVTTEPRTLEPASSLSIDPASFFDDDYDDVDDDMDGPHDGRPSSSQQRMSFDGRSQHFQPGGDEPLRTGGGHPGSGDLSRSSSSAHRMYGSGAAGPSHDASARSNQHQVNIQYTPDGHKVYEGSIGDIFKSTWSDMKSAFKKGDTPNHQQQSLLGSQGAGTSASHGGASGAGAGKGGFLDRLFADRDQQQQQQQQQRGYQKQNTGDGRSKPGLLSRYVPQMTGGTLLEGSDGRLRQPPAPQRPLATTSLQPQRASQPLQTAPSMTSLMQPAQAPAAAPAAPPPAPAASAAKPATALDDPSASEWDAFVSAPPAAPGTSTVPTADLLDGFAALALGPSGAQAGQKVSLLDL